MAAAFIAAGIPGEAIAFTRAPEKMGAESSIAASEL